MGLKNVIAEFFSAESGQERRQWLTGKEEQFGNALDYALGPDIAPRVNALAQAGAMISPGADVMEAQQAGRDMFAPDRSPMDRAASGAAMVGAGAMMLMPGGASSVRQGVESVVDAGVRAYDPNVLNMFAGRNAATADTETLARAEDMLEGGASRDDVLRDTGWFRGIDGRMRFEIDDSGSVMRQDAASLLNNGEAGQNLRTDLDGAMLHQELLGGDRRGKSYQAAYEDLGQGFVNSTRNARTSGSYNHRTGDIEIGAADSVEGRSVLLHEVQHGIQGREGFARGSSPERELSKIYEGRNIRKRELSAQMDKVRAEEGLHGYGASHPRLTPLSDEYNSLMEFDTSTANATARQNYNNSAGEVESRNASLRAAMSPARRIETPPWATQDVPDAEQIVDFGGDTAYSADIPATPAQEIARLLSEGRADEVTDELYAQADPQELHQLYTSGATGVDMPMDTPSRMARADERLPGEGYHGTDQVVAEFDPARFGQKDPGWYGRGVTTDTDPEVAAGYANYDEAEIGQNIIPVRIAGKHMNWPEGQLPFGNANDARSGTRDISSLGYDGTQMRNDRDLYGDAPDWQTERVTFDPSNIRSKFARFDPRLSHLRNLSAGVAGAGAVGIAAQSRQPEERRELPPLAPELAFMKDIYR